MSTPDQLLSDFFRAFASRDYQLCLKQSEDVLRVYQDVETLQVLLISLQRLNDPDHVPIAQALMESTTDAWKKALLQLTTGSGSLESLLISAHESRQQAQVFYYSGARKLTLGDCNGAQRLFASAMSVGADCIESQLAKVELSLAPSTAILFKVPVSYELRILCQEAYKLLEAGRYTEALPLVQEGHQLAREELDPLDRSYLWFLNNLGFINMQLGHYELAEKLLQEAVDADRKRAKSSVDLATALKNLATLYSRMGQDERAEPPLIEAVEILENSGNRSEFAEILQDLVDLYSHLSRWRAAVPVARKLVEITREQTDDYPKYLEASRQLATVYQEAGDHQNAKRTLLELVQEMKQRTTNADLDSACIMTQLAQLHIADAEHQAAEALLKEAMLFVQHGFNEHHPNYISALNNLATVYHGLHNYKEAERIFTRAIDIERTLPPEDRPNFAARLLNLGKLYEEATKFKEAEATLLEAVALIQEESGQVSVQYNSAASRLASFYFARGAYDKAEEILIALDSILSRPGAENDPGYLQNRSNLATVTRAKRTQNRPREIEADLSEALYMIVRPAFSPTVRTQAEFDSQLDAAHDAVELARSWPSSWVSRAIIYLAQSFFLMEPAKAVELYGGLEGVREFFKSENVEHYFIRGYSRIFRGERQLALPAFRAAAKVEPENPYVLFSLIVCFKLEPSHSNELVAVLEKLKEWHPSHPITRFVDMLDRAGQVSRAAEN